MKAHLIPFVAVLSLSIACGKQATGPGAGGALTGDWSVTFSGTESVTEVTGTLSLHQQADTLTGTFTRAGKQPVLIEDGYARADTVFLRFRGNLTADAPRYLYTLKGWIQNNATRMQGTWWYMRGSGQWQAARK